MSPEFPYPREYKKIDNFQEHPGYSEPITEKEPTNHQCPFCGDDDYDLIGLKHHLVSCKMYAKTENYDPRRQNVD